MGHYDDRDYAVGKGKPPVEHQFKKGKSGNPTGPSHKKKARDATLEVLAHEAVNEMVSVLINGRERRLPKKQAIVLGIVNDGLAGTPAQRLKALKALKDIGAFVRTIEDHRLTPEMEQERAIALLNLLREEGMRDEEMRHHFAEYNRLVP
ncbi:hypothetical protein ASF00_17635 [Sphingomonas sp. Leaf34]|uniref:DUF5681 domain-containing protein n=1 Tax=Sphingomonas sp. Leaf34 TaxID=1736216 RepID=UPI0006F738D8|nr:DUF5681 domain-containing protein [Sphingomonas sp. Leaf34]KQN24025.1 hypothetical protein ASF00_17635 [Sphingomonas sp. Leaf34]